MGTGVCSPNSLGTACSSSSMSNTRVSDVRVRKRACCRAESRLRASPPYIRYSRPKAASSARAARPSSAGRRQATAAASTSSPSTGSISSEVSLHPRAPPSISVPRPSCLQAAPSPGPRPRARRSASSQRHTWYSVAQQNRVTAKSLAATRAWPSMLGFSAYSDSDARPAAVPKARRLQANTYSPSSTPRAMPGSRGRNSIRWWSARGWWAMKAMGRPGLRWWSAGSTTSSASNGRPMRYLASGGCSLLSDRSPVTTYEYAVKMYMGSS